MATRRAVVVALMLSVVPRAAFAQAPAPAVAPPVLETFVSAPFPEAGKGQSGAVVLVLEVDAEGRVTQASVKEPAGHGFDEAAMAAAQKFVFKPATRAGRPVPARILYRYTFQEAAPESKLQTAPAKGTLRGVVRLAASNAPLAGARVTVKTAVDVREVTTGADGSWSAGELAAGTYDVRVTGDEIASFDAREEVSANQETAVVYRPKLAAVVDEVVVRGEAPPREVTKRSLGREELSRVPGTGGDALKAITSLPGLARPPGFLNQLIVRGSAPEDTRIFVDGTPVPIVYHFGGFSSVLPTEVLERIDFFPSNFSAQYGRAIGGAIDVATREVKRDERYHGLAQVDLIDARLLATGPLPVVPKTTFLFAARRSHIDAWIGPVLETGGAVGATTAPVYYDYQAFLETQLASRSTLRLGYFGADDRVKLFLNEPPDAAPTVGGELGAHTGFGRLQALYRGEVSDRVKLRANVAYGYDTSEFKAGNIQINLNTMPLSSRAEVSAKVAPWLTLNLGEDVLYTTADIDVRAPMPPRPGETDPGTISSLRYMVRKGKVRVFEPGAFLEAEFTPLRWLRVVPGGRVDYDDDIDEWAATGRINARAEVYRDGDIATTLKGGTGTFRQRPTFQETDLVFGSRGLGANRATHHTLGVEQSLSRYVTLSVDAYTKDLTKLVSRVPTTFGNEYQNVGSGNVVGTETLLRYKPDGRFFGWLAYSLSRSTRRATPEAPETLFQYDQTHVLTAVGSYKLGRGWEVGARFRLVSGPLYTPCAGIGGTLDASSASYVCNGGVRPFSERLPLFHQLDLRGDKTWDFKAWKLSTYLDIQNVYSRQNAEDISYNFDFSKRAYQKGLPIIPSLGLRAEF